MGHVLKTRVAETASLTGTGPVTLSVALTAHRRLADVCSVGDTTEYHIIAVDGAGNPTGAWEEGIGTYSSANTLTRTTVTDSSNAGSAVSFAGNVVVIMTPVAKRVGFVPRGGTVGQVVAKTGSGDFDAAWADQTGGSVTEGAVAAILHAASAKTTLVDADEVNGTDSAATWGLIRTTWAQVWTYIKSKADAVYAAVSHNHAASDISSGTIGTARLGSGTANSTTYLRGDQTWATVAGGGTPGGSDTQVQFNDGGTLAGDPIFIFDKVNKKLVLQLPSNTGNTAFAIRSGIYDAFTVTTAGQVGFGYSSGITNAGSITCSGLVATSYITATKLAWGSEAGDVGLNRESAGRLVIYDANTLTNYRDLKARNLIASGGVVTLASFTVSTLPSASTSGAGAQAFVTDANATTPRSTVAGGGSNKVNVFSDGTNWLIAA